MSVRTTKRTNRERPMRTLGGATRQAIPSGRRLLLAATRTQADPTQALEKIARSFKRVFPADDGALRPSRRARPVPPR